VKGLCPKCMLVKQLTKHHIFPLRYFHKQIDPVYLHLCRSCHSNLEYKISRRERGKKLSKNNYLKIVIEFLTTREN